MITRLKLYIILDIYIYTYYIFYIIYKIFNITCHMLYVMHIFTYMLYTLSSCIVDMAKSHWGKLFHVFLTQPCGYFLIMA